MRVRLFNIRISDNTFRKLIPITNWINASGNLMYLGTVSIGLFYWYSKDFLTVVPITLIWISYILIEILNKQNNDRTGT